MKHGFALLELLLGLAIASLLTSLLFSVLYQTNRAVQTVNTIVDGHTKAIFCYQIMARDIAGATIPLELFEQYAKKDQPQQKEQENSQKDQSKAPGNTGPVESQKAEKEHKPLSHVFYADTRDGLLHQLTFITMNSLPVYRLPEVGGKPRIARVMYRLKPSDRSARDKPSFTLYRQESSSLEYDSLKEEAQGSARAYEVITHIKRMTLKFTVAIKQEGKKEEGASPEATQWRTMTDWNVERNGGNPDLIKNNILLPTMVEITLVLWHPTRLHDEQYVFTVPINAVHEIPKEGVSSAAKQVATPLEKVTPEGAGAMSPLSEASAEKSIVAVVADPVDAHQVIDRIRSRTTRSTKVTRTRPADRSKDAA